MIKYPYYRPRSAEFRPVFLPRHEGPRSFSQQLQNGPRPFSQQPPFQRFHHNRYNQPDIPRQQHASAMFPSPITAPTICHENEVEPSCDQNYNRSDKETTEKYISHTHDWIEEWVQSRVSHKVQRQYLKESPLQASALQDCLNEAHVLLNTLRQLRCQMSAATDENAKAEIITTANKIKDKFEVVRTKITGNENRLKKHVEQARQKRERRKRKRKQVYEARLAEEERRREKHREADAWLRAIQERVQDEKTERELKSIADKTLCEVRLKVSEARRALDALRVVAALRRARKLQNQQNGLYVSATSDVLFEQRREALVTLVTRQLETYQHEQRLLQTMLDTEREELKEHEEEQRRGRRDQQQRLETRTMLDTEREELKEHEEQEQRRRRRDQQQRLETRIRRMLFGPEAVYPPTHPLYPFFLYYNAANLSATEFLRIRREWDSYIVPEDNILGSSIPSGWVTPAPPSDDNWKTALP